MLLQRATARLLPVAMLPARRQSGPVPTYPSIGPLRTSFPAIERALGLPRGHVRPGATLPLDRIQLSDLLGAEDGSETERELFDLAESVTAKVFGNKVWLRGIVEFSNVCEKNCNYCGIRHDMPEKSVGRYTMPDSEVVECALWAQRQKMGTVMLQSGEVTHPSRIQWLADTISQIRRRSIEEDKERKRGIAVALSVGEQSIDDYRRLFDAGGRRFLLRIETSNPLLYRALHPSDGRHTWERRLQALRDLRRVGFQLGTGVMIGLPDQTLWDLAGDILFFKEIDADMIGMGPYVLQSDTPTGRRWSDLHGSEDREELHRRLFSLSSRMIACTRVVLGDVNIAATTALQAINPIGREICLRRGANLMMPILTPTKYREEYQLYEGKPCIHEAAEDCHGCLLGRVLVAGKEVAGDDWGDPPHFGRKELLASRQARSD
eukprot:m51a1_g2865 putative hydrogenase maturase protein E (435) ;mRNA; r:351089-352715